MTEEKVKAVQSIFNSVGEQVALNEACQDFSFYLVKAIATALKATITVQSPEGVGSSFSIYMPIRPLGNDHLRYASG